MAGWSNYNNLDMVPTGVLGPPTKFRSPLKTRSPQLNKSCRSQYWGTVLMNEIFFFQCEFIPIVLVLGPWIPSNPVTWPLLLALFSDIVVFSSIIIFSHFLKKINGINDTSNNWTYFYNLLNCCFVYVTTTFSSFKFVVLNVFV